MVALPIQKSDEALAMFRHDLMTPINLIFGYTEMVEEKIADNDTDALGEDLSKIKQAARRLLELIEVNTRHSQSSEDSPPRAVTVEPTATHKHQTNLAESAETECFLVVDDDEQNRELLTRFLQREGFRCMTAGNGIDALDVLRAGSFELILLDAKMPEMDGFELLRILKADSALKHIPVIMISAFTDMERTAECIKQGAEDYLPKPFNSALLLARVSASLEKKRLRDGEQRMFRELAESQKALAEELKEAAAHVHGLLPSPWPLNPRIDWRFVPSTTLGGDAFGYFQIDPDHLAIFLLDVCGHGVSAALHSISVMSAIRGRSLPGADFRCPTSVMEALNRVFQMSEFNNMYFTIWYGVYDLPNRRLAYASAGHPAAILLESDELGPLVRKLGTGGPIIGMLPELTFKSAEIDIRPDTELFVFSDGTYELSKFDGGMLTFEEFVDMLVKPSPDDSPKLDRVLGDARKLRNNETFEDDFSLLHVVF